MWPYFICLVEEEELERGRRSWNLRNATKIYAGILVVYAFLTGILNEFQVLFGYIKFR